MLLNLYLLFVAGVRTNTVRLRAGINDGIYRFRQS